MHNHTAYTPPRQDHRIRPFWIRGPVKSRLSESQESVSSGSFTAGVRKSVGDSEIRCRIFACSRDGTALRVQARGRAPLSGIHIQRRHSFAATTGPDCGRRPGRMQEDSAPERARTAEARAADGPSPLVRVIGAILRCTCHGQRTRVQRRTATVIGVVS